MWCLALTGPCCCGPCQMRITTGAKIVFFANLVLMFLMTVVTILMLDSHLAIFLCSLFCLAALLNTIGLTGLRKNSSFLPLPSSWRQNLKLRDKYQYCLLVPWLVFYGLLTLLWTFVFLPAIIIVSTDVILRCLRLVKKGGQHYIAPDTSNSSRPRDSAREYNKYITHLCRDLIRLLTSK